MNNLFCIATLLISASVVGCASHSVKTVDAIPAIQARHEIPEEELLDVGIVVFNPGVPTDEEALAEAGIFPEIREAESRYLPFTLKQTLQDTGHWGAVRVLPARTSSVDVLVKGEIVASDGETLAVDINAKDAAGREWLQKRYTQSASRYSYGQDTAAAKMDPFQDLYDAVANDLLAARQELSSEEIRALRTISELKFARELSPYAFQGYLEKNWRGQTEINRLPANNDPMLKRVRQIRNREYLFIDTLDQHYANFQLDMQDSYQDWREASHAETVALKEIKGSALKRMLLGAASIIGGVALAAGSDGSAAGALGNTMVLGGAMALASGIDKNAQSQIHADALQELGSSLETEVEPRMVKLEGETVTLTGSIEAQFKKWRRLLKKIYATETGFAAHETRSRSKDL
jgi:hypothetical protein